MHSSSSYRTVSTGRTGGRRESGRCEHVRRGSTPHRGMGSPNAEEEIVIDITALVTLEMLYPLFPGTPPHYVDRHLPHVLNAMHDAGMGDRHMLAIACGALRLVAGPGTSRGQIYAAKLTAAFLKRKEPRFRAILARDTGDEFQADTLLSLRRVIDGKSHGMEEFTDTFARALDDLP